MMKQIGVGFVVVMFFCISGLNYANADKLKLNVSIAEQFAAFFWNNTGAANYTLYYAFPDSQGGIDPATIGDIPMGIRRTLSLIWPLPLDLYVAVYDGIQFSNVELIGPDSDINIPSLFDGNDDGTKSCECTGTIFITYVDEGFHVEEITEIPICLGGTSTSPNYFLRMGTNTMEFIGKQYTAPGNWIQWEAFWVFIPKGEVVWSPAYRSYFIVFDANLNVLDKLILYEDNKKIEEIPVHYMDVPGLISLPFNSGTEMITPGGFGGEFWFQLKLNDEDAEGNAPCLLPVPLVTP